ncbi:MAG: hypothetical protein EXR52_04570 [Dehalococcoidia bacterium]|nr:hypothetical protein [Dehalococcoidia bacterium]
MYKRARHYDPALPRLLSRDPLPDSMWDAQTQNAYAGNNPVTRSDPMDVGDRAGGRPLR